MDAAMQAMVPPEAPTSSWPARVMAQGQGSRLANMRKAAVAKIAKS